LVTFSKMRRWTCTAWQAAPASVASPRRAPCGPPPNSSPFSQGKRGHCAGDAWRGPQPPPFRRRGRALRVDAEREDDPDGLGPGLLARVSAASSPRLTPTPTLLTCTPAQDPRRPFTALPPPYRPGLFRSTFPSQQYLSTPQSLSFKPEALFRGASNWMSD
jgi:hypothetical protein